MKHCNATNKYALSSCCENAKSWLKQLSVHHMNLAYRLSRLIKTYIYVYSEFCIQVCDMYTIIIISTHKIKTIEPL